ncbi:MAG: RNA methyltransferase [bacterium]|nr:RNA methyltransferase [bacterium]
METLSKNKLAYLRKFHKKKIRREHRKCLIEGNKLCSEALENGYEIEVLVYSMGGGRSLAHIIDHRGVKQVLRAPEKTIRSLSEVETPQGVIGLVSIPYPENKPGKKPGSRYLALDSISDPGNMGTIIRSASWYGIDGVICSEKCVEILNSKVVRSSMGAIFHLGIWENLPLKQTLANMKSEGFYIVGSTPDSGKNEMTNAERSVIVIGSEARGLSEDILNICDETISIKGGGKAESMNAAVSAGILLDRSFNRH